MIKMFKKSTISRLFFIVALAVLLAPLASLAQTGNISPTDVDINKPTFRLLICDGPPLPSNVPPPKENYVPCDFKGLMMQIQHLISIAMVLGVLVAIVGFTWAGALYISGNPKKIQDAHAIFPKVFWGFIIMLSAWFVVYQILNWLTGSKGFGVLLGNP